MSCEDTDIEQGFFQGDDLIDAIIVNKPENSDDITITQAELQVGILKFVESNPVFPYTVSIMRDKSKLLTSANDVFLRITYNDENGHTGVRTTCLGKLTLNVNAQAVKD